MILTPFRRAIDQMSASDTPRVHLAIWLTSTRIALRGFAKFSVHRRWYGSFCRVIPLPEGAIADSAKANFKDGVLEILMQAPSREVSRGRRVEITEGAGSKESSQAKSGESQR